MSTITLKGMIPGKKNRLRPSRSGGYYYDRGDSKAIQALTWQAKAQWKRDPIDCPAIDAIIYCKDLRGDLDNKWTCLQDVLVKAGVLINDNLMHLNGPITIQGMVGDEGAVISIYATVEGW